MNYLVFSTSATDWLHFAVKQNNKYRNVQLIGFNLKTNEQKLVSVQFQKAHSVRKIVFNVAKNVKMLVRQFRVFSREMSNAFIAANRFVELETYLSPHMKLQKFVSAEEGVVLEAADKLPICSSPNRVQANGKGCLTARFQTSPVLSSREVYSFSSKQFALENHWTIFFFVRFKKVDLRAFFHDNLIVSVTKTHLNCTLKSS
jgi:hypothetical protein